MLQKEATQFPENSGKEDYELSKFKALITLAIFFLIVFTAYSAEKGTLRVVVVDDEGTMLPGVSLILSSPVMMGTRAQISDENGEVLFINLTPGIYEITSSLEGFQGKTSQNIQVSLDKQTLLQIELQPATIEESVTVTAVFPAVDTTKSVIAEHVTHDTMESLPIARDFVGYLQLAAGVNIVPNSQGRDMPQDPAGKGGLNYRDRGAQGPDPVSGTGGGKRGSRDNLYLLDGMNITGLASQTALMTFNNEVIQEQELMTSGVPAEYGGGKGVVGNVVTKSGGNMLSGSVNFYYQPKGLFLPFGGSNYDEADNPDTLLNESTLLEAYKDNKYDTAFTLGGPALKDKLWFFGSGQYRSNASDLPLSESASPTREAVDYSQKRIGLFGKLTFKLSANDSFNFMYFQDDYDITGDRDQNLPKNRQQLNDYGMGAYSAYYQRVLGTNLIVDFRYGHYWWGRVFSPRYNDAGIPDTLYYIAGTYPPRSEYVFGGYAWNIDDDNTRDQFQFNAEYYLGNMRLKAGIAYWNEYDKDDSYYYFDKQSRTSLDPNLNGYTLGELLDAGVWAPSEYYQRLLPRLNNYWGPTSDAFDFNHDGVVTDDELRQATFSDLNEHGLNFTRTLHVQTGANKVRAMRYIGYLMDDWKINQYFTLNAGVRIENHLYRNSEGGTILDMPFAFLPRIGLVWNIGGRGTHKLTAFYGHFSDPMPFGMIHFAGNISGRVSHEQIWLNGDWYTFRIRGSAENRDCVWTPNTRDNYGREFSLTHEIDVGNGLVFSTQGYYRGDRNIIEDYDLYTYVNAYEGDPLWGHLDLSYEDFGYPASGPPAGVNYFLSNLIGAKRDIWGLDFEVSKRFEGGSFIVAQYSFKHATGNSQSDGNADLQGDMIEIDPRNPWMMGNTPGSIPHMIKFFGTYRTPFGLDIGALFYWNSGMYFTESYSFLPGAYDIYINWPLNDAWTDFAKTGDEKTPAYYQIDLKLNYGLRLYGSAVLDFFLDVYNLTNNQSGVEIAYAQNDQTWLYKDITEILMPMRFYVGARIRF